MAINNPKITKVFEGMGSDLDFLQWLDQDNEINEERLLPKEVDRLRLAIKLLANLETNIQNSTLESGQFEFRFNQLNCLKDLRRFIANCGHGELRGYMVQPTGGGKTILFASIAKLLGVKSLILVPTIQLLGQTKEEMCKVLNIPEEEIGVVGGGEDDTSKRYTLCTYDSFRVGILNETRLGLSEVELVISDELDKSFGEQTNIAMNHWNDYLEADPEPIDFDELEVFYKEYAATFPLVLGFGATTSLGGKRAEDYYRTCISRVSREELVNAGFLKKYSIIHVDGEIDETYADKNYINEDDEVEILNREGTYKKLLEKYKETSKEAPYKLRTVVFCTRISECQKFQDLAAEMGYESMIISSKIGADDLEIAEKKLMNGEIEFIIGVNMVGRGWNFKPLNSVIWARATNSATKLIQGAGRAGRAYEDERTAYFFETDWRMKTKYTGIPEPGLEKVPNEERPKSNGKKKKRPTHLALTLAQAFVDNGETPEAVCSNYSGESLEYSRSLRLDENGMVTLEHRGETMVLVGSTSGAAAHYRVSPTSMRKRLNTLKPVSGIIGLSGRQSLDLYRKEDVDTLFPKVIDVDENGIATIQHEGEKIEVVGYTSKAIDHYKTSPATMKRRVANIKPIPGIIGKAGVHSYQFYRKSEVDALFPKIIALNANSIGVIKDGDKEIEVVGAGQKIAKYYGVSWPTFNDTVAHLEGIPGYRGRTFRSSGNAILYKKSEVDKIFSKRVELDNNALGVIEENGNKIDVVGRGGRAAAFYGFSISKFYGALEALEPIKDFIGVASTHGYVVLYNKSEVDNIFNKIIRLNDCGIGVIDYKGEQIEVISCTPKAAKAYNITVRSFQALFDDLQPIPDFTGISNRHYVKIYKKSELDEKLDSMEG